MKLITKIILSLIAIVFVGVVGLYLFEQYHYPKQYEKGKKLFEEGKYEEAIVLYQSLSPLFYSYYEAYSGEVDSKEAKRVSKKLNTVDELIKEKKWIQAQTELSEIDEKIASFYYHKPKKLIADFEKKKKAFYQMIEEKASAAKENEEYTKALELYEVLANNSDEEAKKELEPLRKKAFLQEYDRQNWLAATIHYQNYKKNNGFLPKDLSNKGDYTSIKTYEVKKESALKKYEEGNISDVKTLTLMLSKISPTSQYTKEAQNAIQDLDEEVSFFMAKNEFEQENLDEALHFYAQISPESAHYQVAQSQIKVINDKLEKEYSRTSLSKKRKEAYAEVKKQLQPTLQNLSSYTVILGDADQNAAGGVKKLMYNVVYQTSGKVATKTTDYMQVSDSTFDYFQDDVGMELFSHKSEQVSPAGYGNYVGNNQYGEWKEDDSGSFWEFYGQYALLSTMFGASPIYRDDYRTYNNYYRTTRRPYYGSVYVPVRSVAKENARFQQTVNRRAQKSWFYAKSAPKRSSNTTKATANKSWYYGRQPASRSSYASRSASSNRGTYGRSSYSSSSSSSSYSSSSSSSYRSSSSRSSSSRTYRSSSSSSRSRSSSRGGK